LPLFLSPNKQNSLPKPPRQKETWKEKQNPELKEENFPSSETSTGLKRWKNSSNS